MTRPPERVALEYYAYTIWAWFVIVSLTVVFLPFVTTYLLLCLFLDHDRRLILPINQCRAYS